MLILLRPLAVGDVHALAGQLAAAEFTHADDNGPERVVLGTRGERRAVVLRVVRGPGSDESGEIALRASHSICARIASSMLGEPVAPDNAATVLDAVAEFLNVVGGNLSAAAARMGKKLELSAPKAGGLPPPTTEQHMIIARLGAPEGEIEFVVLTSR